MSYSTGIFTGNHILVLTQYRPRGTFRLGMPQCYEKSLTQEKSNIIFRAAKSCLQVLLRVTF